MNLDLQPAFDHRRGPVRLEIFCNQTGGSLGDGILRTSSDASNQARLECDSLCYLPTAGKREQFLKEGFCYRLQKVSDAVRGSSSFTSFYSWAEAQQSTGHSKAASDQIAQFNAFIASPEEVVDFRLTQTDADGVARVVARA